MFGLMATVVTTKPQVGFLASIGGFVSGVLTLLGIITPIVGAIGAVFGCIGGFFYMRNQYRQWKEKRH